MAAGFHAMHGNFAQSVQVCGFHSVRIEMFIDQSVKTEYQLRSEERNDSGVVKLYLNSAPPNGAGKDIAPQSTPLTG
jgi:hypothetical protein